MGVSGLFLSNFIPYSFQLYSLQAFEINFLFIFIYPSKGSTESVRPRGVRVSRSRRWGPKIGSPRWRHVSWPHPLQLLFPDKAERGSRFATPLLLTTQNLIPDSGMWFMSPYFTESSLQRLVLKKVGGKTPPQLIFVYPKDSVIYLPLSSSMPK